MGIDTTLEIFRNGFQSSCRCIALLVYSSGQDPTDSISCYSLDIISGLWVLNFTIGPVVGRVGKRLQIPQCLTTGEFVIQMWEGDRLTTLYDPKRSILYDAENGDLQPIWFQSYIHAETLVSIKGMEPLGRIKQKVKQHKDKKMHWTQFLGAGYKK